MSAKDDKIGCVPRNISPPVGRSAAMRRRQPSKGDAREQALLSAAERLLQEDRFDDASVEDLAREAGISRPTFYFYFSSKHALLAGLIDRTMNELLREVRASQQKRLATGEGAGEMIRRSLRSVADMWWRHRAVLAAVVDMAAPKSGLFERIQFVNEALVEEVVETLVAAGTTPEVADERRARETALQLAWMCERNFYVLARTSPTRNDLHKLADQLSTIWLRTAGII